MDASNYDFERFTLEKMESWSKKELSQFLILDHFNLFKEIGFKDTEKLIFDDLQSSTLKYNQYKFILYFLDRFSLKFLRNKTKILFEPFKYYNIILGVKKYHRVGLIAPGNRDRLIAFKNFMGYIITDDLDRHVLAYLKEKRIEHLYRLVKETENKLMAVKPDYIVLWNDTLSVERAIVLVSKKLGIGTLEIQHGAFDSSRPLTTGKIVDYVLVWGKYFKDLYIKQGGRKPEDVYILGYPYLIKKNQEIQKKNSHCAVYYLGQNFEVYNKKFFNIKIETLKKINEICSRLGMKFVYRPHPGDDRELLKKNLTDIQFTDAGEGLEETFKKADILISFNSTSLVEAAMRSKISLQLMNYPIKSNNFEKLGVCNKTLQTFNELENYLAEIISVSDLDKFKLNFNNDYIETRYNPIERFSEIIKEIEENKKL